MAARKKKAETVTDGLEVVRAVVGVMSENPSSTFWPKRLQRKPKPLKAGQAERLLPAGFRLPPSLQTWLTLASEIEGLDFGVKQSWRLATLQEHAAERFGEMAGYLVSVAKPKFEAPCLVLREEAGNKLEVLYSSAPDSTGELPILQAYLENPGYSHIALWHPGFDVFLASQLKPELAARFGVPGGGERVDVDDARWGARMREHMKRLGMSKSMVKLGK